MINIFDLSAGMTGTKMLTEKPHRDGSPARRDRSDTVKKVVDPAGVHIEDKQVVTHELRNSSRKRSNGTPMKKLIEQEMSKEMETQRNPPSIVAKLMGLDTFPAQRLASVKERTVQEGSNKTHSSVHSVISGAISRDNQLEKKNVYGRGNTPNTGSAGRSLRSQSSEHRVYKDVYEVPARTYRSKDEEPLMMPGRFDPNEKRMDPQHERFGLDDNRMDLVREKFTEAKRLATNRKLLHSKEFQDAIEILSSNRDLFLKFLEEPNSLFSEYIHELQRGRGAHQQSQIRRITVLKPSNPPPETAAADDKLKSYIPIHGATDEVERGSKPRLNSSACIHPKDNNKPLLSQPTRIVVLKPSPAKSLNGKMPASASPPMSPVHAEEESFRELQARENRRYPRNADKEVTQQQLQDSYCPYRRDETLLSSVLSNGYTGDESSFNRSECEYMDDDDDGFGNSSDSDIPSPVTRHSWDCNHRFDSPCSLSSFSRASYSPESSVIREAKKRLSERWVMVASNELGREQKQVRRSVSTLGEMLAIRGANKEEEAFIDGVSLRTGSYGREQQELNTASSSSACVSGVKSDGRNDGVNENLPTLQRSKSVPASTSAYDDISGSDPRADKSLSKDKTKSGKSLSSSSFKLKVSNFFSRNKKPSLEKQSSGSQSCNGDSSGRSSPQLGSCNNLNEGSAHHTPLGSPSSTPCRSFSQDAQLFGSSTEAPLVLKASEKAIETSAEPSPDSVLEAGFKDDANHNSRHFYQGAADNIGGSSRAISRSPPIESIARSLPSCDTSIRLERAAAAITNSSARHSLTDFLKADSEEQERDSFVRKLLSAAGMSDETTSSVLTRWHSLDSPLNPSLLDQFLERKGEEARCRVRRSNQRLLFDSVNAALLDISWKGGGAAIKGDVRSRNTCWHLLTPPCAAAASVTTQVLGRLNEWFSDDGGEEEWTCMGYEQETSQVVDRIVRREVGGSGWLEMGALEVLEVCKEMGEQVMQGLVAETLIDFIPFSGQLQ